MPSMIVSLDDAKAEINDPTSTTDDAELVGYIQGVSTVIEAFVGPVATRSLDEFYDGGRDRIYTRTRPILEIATVTEYTPTPQVLAYEPLGTPTFTSFGYRLGNGDSIIRTAGGSIRPFACGQENVEIVYTAGRATVPANIRQAALTLIRLNWQPQQSGNLPGIGTTDDEPEPGQQMLGYYIPPNVLEMLSPDRQVLV